MSIGNPEQFPWGHNTPRRPIRLVVAISFAVVSASLLIARYERQPASRWDFSQVRFGAEALLHGGNPYTLAGPGSVYDSPRPVLYPATAYVAAIPFTLVPDHVAAAIFVALSVFLLAFGATADSWHRLPMFASLAFLTSVQLGQWSILMTAAIFLPLVAIAGVAKPQSIVPVLAYHRTWTAVRAASIGAFLIASVSFVLFPQWPAEWLSVVRENHDLMPPLLRLGGVFILLSLLRWKRPEAWLVAVMACMPQTWGWYNVLPLLAISRTYREACVLSLLSSTGFLATLYFVRDSSNPASYPAWAAAMVATAYLPATIMILRWPNEGRPPAWLTTRWRGPRTPLIDSRK